MRISLTGRFFDDSAWVQSVMYFPCDAHLRESWYAVNLANLQLIDMDPGATVSLDRETLARIVDAPSVHQMRDLSAEAVKQGCIAGDYLLAVYLMHRSDVPEPSLKKAVHLMRKFGDDFVFGDGTKVPRSRRMVREAFESYRSVAHLWVAWRLSWVTPFASREDLFGRQLAQLLEVSQGVLDFGKHFVPFRARPQEPILKDGQMWELPEGTVPVHVPIGGFKSTLLELLEDYDANK